MFIRYFDKKMAINADNFDFIRIEYSGSRYQTGYFVELVRLAAEISCHSGAVDIGSISSADEEILQVKSFETEEDAEKFYNSLQYAWINKLDVFDVK